MAASASARMNDVAVAALLVLVETLVSTMFACRSPRRQMCAQRQHTDRHGWGFVDAHLGRSVIGVVTGPGEGFVCFTNHNQGNPN